jgi:hypothetical protein
MIFIESILHEMPKLVHHHNSSLTIIKNINCHNKDITLKMEILALVFLDFHKNSYSCSFLNFCTKLILKVL